jgi:hypothetical protein
MRANDVDIRGRASGRTDERKVDDLGRTQNSLPLMREAVMAKKFFFVCAGILLLAISFHFGESRAQAQTPGNPLVGLAYGSSALFAAAANGDVYVWNGTAWNRFSSNMFSGPTPTQASSSGALKAKFHN